MLCALARLLLRDESRGSMAAVDARPEPLSSALNRQQQQQQGGGGAIPLVTRATLLRTVLDKLRELPLPAPPS